MNHEIQFEKISNIKDSRQLGVLALAIARCVNSAFEGGVTVEDTMSHIQGDVILVQRDQEKDEVLAFSATVIGSPNQIFQRDDISNEVGTYLAATAVSRDQQSRGAYTAMNVELIDIAMQHNHRLFYTRTQNPRVQSGIERVLQEKVRSGEIHRYSCERILITGAYGKMLTKNKPHDHHLDYTELNYEQGDAYILLFHIQKE
jgi:hypothetical protein